MFFFFLIILTPEGCIPPTYDVILHHLLENLRCLLESEYGGARVRKIRVIVIKVFSKVAGNEFIKFFI